MSQTSRWMVASLRHGEKREKGVPSKLPFRSGMWLSSQDLERQARSENRFYDERGFAAAVAEQGDKKRMERKVLEDGTVLYRAFQGHSVSGSGGADVVAETCSPLNASEVRFAYHGTRAGVVGPIMEKGLLPGERAVHMAEAKDVPRLISGQARRQALVKVDLCRAEQAGLSFFRAGNGTILCNKAIPPQFLSTVPERERTAFFSRDSRRTI